MKPFTSLSSSSPCDHSLLPYNSKKRRHGGCMGKILRRILCINSISSPRPEEDEKEPPMACESDSSTPGIVARLMGLESLRSPVLKSFEPFRKPRLPDGRYHRMIPTYQEILEDENFFILAFESMDFHSGKRNQGSGVKCKKKGTRRGSSHEWEEENVGLSVEEMNNSCNSNPNSNARKREKKKKVKRDDNLTVIKPETEGSPQNSSPNSVLDFMESAPSHRSEDISRLKNSKLRRTLSEELENCTNPKEKTLFINKSPRSNVRAEKWFETRELAELEMIKSSWVCDGMSKNHHEHFQEIGKDLTSQILDQLLLEFIITFS
ncbi:uncharacterized protein LOC142537907 isoform X2 [Primulina tabacum]|uniref:uncharacterized protein LOC142537907 isoform X2 n=1 Tax=Primulina tabacum TaxID=48773 RepID=UPI003F5A131D